jgi:hypothetical protein
MSRSKINNATGTAPTTAIAKATADNNVQIVNVTIAGDGRAGPYYPGPHCKSVMTVATGTCKFQMRGNGGDGPATSVYRDAVMSAEQQTATATKIGVLDGTAIPYEFYLFDTSSSSNPVSMYLVYGEE